MSDPSTQTVDPRRARMQQNAQATASSPATSQPQQAPAQAETSAVPAEQTAETTAAPAEPTAEAATASAESTPFALPQATSSPAPQQESTQPNSATATPAAEGQSASVDEDRATSQDMDAAIAATLAMETDDRQTASNGLQSTAAAVAETIGRDEASTPTLYTAAASEGDVPGAVATPPPATPAITAAAADESSSALPASSNAASVDTKGKGAATSSLSRVAQLTARVEKDPLDGEAQLALLQDAEQKGDLERTREVYERFLIVFPDAAQQWIAYCNLELSHNLFERVEAIFGRCCLNSTSVDLWRFYLDYIRRVNPIDPANIEAAKTARAVIGAAFEFALSHVGHDRRAGEIWSEYIAFLREAPTRGNWEDQQKMDSLRKAFQRAVQAPVNNVEAIWQDYNAFENNLSKMTAKKFIAELSPAYMTARKTLRELRAQHDHLYTPILPHRPSWTSAEDRDALDGWKAYLAYEETNPLEIEDQGQLAQRVAFAYRKAIANLRFYPEVWYLAASYNLKSGRVDDARKQLRDGLTANAGSLLLAYTLADIEEGRSDFTACYGIYDSLIEHLNTRISSLEADVEAEIASAVADKEVEHLAQIKGAQEDGREEEAESVEAREKRSQEIEELQKEIRERKAPEIETVKKAVANVWITEMRFARRSDGLRQARQVFLKAKKSPNLTWQVVEASAAMEMYWNSEPKVATNVFELGLKSFTKEPEYVLRYLDFLISQNNSNNARALFERTIAIIEPAKAKPIWDRMAQYEFQYGDYLAAQKMAQRYAETFPDTTATVRFAQQHQSAGLEDAFALDLGPSFVRQIKRDTRARSPSPQRGRHKRGLSVDRDGADGQDQDGGDAKRARRGLSPSPAPSSSGGGGSGWRPHGSEDHRRSAREAAPALNRAQPYMLDPRGNDVAILPDAVVFFLSLLPPASSFNGPHLNPASIMDIIGTTILPGSAPGPGLPGERLGIPPRPKPQRPAYGGGGGGGGPGGYGGGRRPKPQAREASFEHYAQHTQGYSANLAAVQEAHGFKPEAGRLVVDPAEARVEDGEEVASRLKTNRKGTKILWPQPSDDPNDPQNWSAVKKNIQLLVLTMASFVPDFCSGLGIASLFNLAETFKTTTEEINNLTSNWSIFLLGPGGIAAVFFIKRFGRLPVLFWSQVIGLGFLIGCAVSPDLKTFAAMRCLTAFFASSPPLLNALDCGPSATSSPSTCKRGSSTSGRWASLCRPSTGPFLLGYMIPTTNFRDVYWVGVAYCAVVILLITFIMEETMYDRDVVPFPERHATGLKYRIDTLIGITGWKMRKYRCKSISVDIERL